MIRTLKLIFPSPPARAISFPLVRTTTLGQWLYPDIVLHMNIYMLKTKKKKKRIGTTVDSRYLEFDGTMEKIWVNRSSTQEELRRYWKCRLFNNERETTLEKFWRAKTSIACPYSRNDFKHIQCFCCSLFISPLNSLNLVKRLITSRYLFLCEWICLSVLLMFFTCCIVIKLHPSWRIFLCAILFIYNKLYVFIIQ